MKIRIANDSIRFRLKQPEVASFHATGFIIEKIDFGTRQQNQLSFRLKKYSGFQFALCYENNELTVSVPEHLSDQWAKTDLVGLDAEWKDSTNKLIHVLIEKDFACLDASEKENEGTYAHPSSTLSK